jgi:uncharacterized DUF497 family protein
LKFEWDVKKAKANEQKHKITFLEACYVFADKFLLSLFDEEHSSKEERWMTIGKSLSGKILVVVHTYKKTKDTEVTRIISARKATKNEEKQYFERRG